MKFSNPPIKTGQELIVNPFTIGNKGDPVAKFNGFTIIIKDPCEVGQPVIVKIEGVYEKYAYARKKQ